MNIILFNQQESIFNDGKLKILDALRIPVKGDGKTSNATTDIFGTRPNLKYKFRASCKYFNCRDFSFLKTKTRGYHFIMRISLMTFTFQEKVEIFSKFH